VAFRPPPQKGAKLFTYVMTKPSVIWSGNYALRDAKLCCLFHRRSPLIPILSQLSTVHIATLKLLNVIFNIAPPPSPAGDLSNFGVAEIKCPRF